VDELYHAEVLHDVGTIATPFRLKEQSGDRLDVWIRLLYRKGQLNMYGTKGVKLLQETPRMAAFLRVRSDFLVEL